MKHILELCGTIRNAARVIVLKQERLPSCPTNPRKASTAAI
jgi:hypothetical protein